MTPNAFSSSFLLQKPYKQLLCEKEKKNTMTFIIPVVFLLVEATEQGTDRGSEAKR